MLVAGTFRLERFEDEGWRVGVQLGASRGWFLERRHGAFWRWSYGPGVFPAGGLPGEDEPPGGESGGVREPRRPSPSAGGAEVALEP